MNEPLPLNLIGIQHCPYLHDDGTKTCNTCKERKPITDFGTTKKNTHGRLNRCKRCTSLKQRASETYKASWKKWYDKRMANPVWRAQENERLKQKRLAAPDKHKARRICRNAVIRGVILKRPCEVCRNPNSQAHHHDYSKPLAVVWLCQDHHAEEHRIYK